MAERLQKYLAKAGIGSRRFCEDLIKSKKIKVNNEVALIGTKVAPSDIVEFDGRMVKYHSEVLKVLLLNKPEGVLSSSKREKKIPIVALTSGILITFFGGLTLYFDNKVFFYMKPTIINLLFASTLLFSKYFTKKPLLKIFFKNSMNLKDDGWEKLNYRWVYFFIFVAILNEIVWRIYCPEKEYIWVNFKVWGLLPITFLFTASQIPLINKYKLE